MSDRPMRVVILCEDRMQEQFLARLCDTQGFRIMERIVAPKGKGAASGWVMKQAHEHVRVYRKFRRENRALLVGIDGDDKGVVARRAAFDDALVAQGLEKRSSKEAIAILVPTWSIETWILYLHDGTVIPEGQKSKGSVPDGLRAKEHGTLKSEVIAAVMAAWKRVQSEPPLPSLADGRQEMARLETSSSG